MVGENCWQPGAVHFISYSLLNRQANQLARELINRGIDRNQVAAIMVAPCVQMVVGILAVLKTGGFYLPIDPLLPADRIAFMLKDSGSGEVESYIEFCKNLDHRLNCWGIRADEIERYSSKNQTIEEIAGSYIRKIKTIQSMVLTFLPVGVSAAPLLLKWSGNWNKKIKI